jgi:hypothetical protein
MDESTGGFRTLILRSDRFAGIDADPGTSAETESPYAPDLELIFRIPLYLKKKN